MDPNVKDILLVALGAFSSILGTALTLFFGLRRDRWLVQIERKREEYAELVDFLRTLSSLSATVTNFIINESHYPNLDRQEYIDTSLNPLMIKLSHSPLHGLPPMLMTRNKSLVNKLQKLGEFEVNMTTYIKAFIDGRPFPQEVLDTIITENNKMNALIDLILSEGESRLGF